MPDTSFATAVNLEINHKYRENQTQDSVNFHSGFFCLFCLEKPTNLSWVKEK